MAQQTAVKFLLELFTEKFSVVKPTHMSSKEFLEKYDNGIEKANEMFKEQINKAHSIGFADGVFEKHREYYNETFGKQ